MPEVAEDVQPDPILAQFSGMGRPELAKECARRGIPANEPGSTAAVLLGRLVEYERAQADPNLVTADDDDDLLGLGDDADDGIVMASGDPEPPVPGMAASVPVAGPSGQGVVERPRPRRATYIEEGVSGIPVEVRNGASIAPEPTTGVIGRYRKAFVVGDLNPSDEQHFAMIRMTHEAAAAEGHRPRGGAWVGTRVGYGVNGQGVRTAIYEISIRRK